MELIGNKWDEVLQEEYNKDYFKKIVKYINLAYLKNSIYPNKSHILRALSLTDFDQVKVVILGQDPYHGIGQANGLSFSVNNGVSLPPSLKNIYKELKSDLNIDMPNNGDLTSWANQGVLMLNSILTVEKDRPASHKDLGWQIFTDKIIASLSSKEAVVYILWGNYARSKKTLITNKNHLIIESSHPSPYSCTGFFGSKPFSRTNEYLKKCKKKEINWKID